MKLVKYSCWCRMCGKTLKLHIGNAFFHKIDGDKAIIEIKGGELKSIDRDLIEFYNSEDIPK
ncbi:MAG: hypothetical protein WC901_00970 [Candidatus Margulisiibacteriota bacterium]